MTPDKKDVLYGTLGLMVIKLPALVIAATLSMPGATSAQPVSALYWTVSEAKQGGQEAQGIPPNIVAAPLLRGVLDATWQQSRTFKAQCARLRGAPFLFVEIRFGNSSQIGAARARTDYVRSAGDIRRAHIYIDPDLRSLAHLIELIAHELEHVIEQLDEVELEAADRHGVFKTASGAFETARAIHIGRQVSSEVSAATNRGSGARGR